MVTVEWGKKKLYYYYYYFHQGGYLHENISFLYFVFLYLYPCCFFFIFIIIKVNLVRGFNIILQPLYMDRLT